jgi:hypothetical protein
MILSEAYDLPHQGCLPGSFPKFNFIKDWNGLGLRWLERPRVVGTYGWPCDAAPAASDSFLTTRLRAFNST